MKHYTKQAKNRVHFAKAGTFLILARGRNIQNSKSAPVLVDIVQSHHINDLTVLASDKTKYFSLLCWSLPDRGVICHQAAAFPH